MDRIWSPWRYRYVSKVNSSGFVNDCVFCRIAAANTAIDDQANYVLLRAERNFLMLNLYPYTSGHLMVVPYEHVADLAEAAPETLTEMMQLTVRADAALRSVYKPGGVNIGMNLGKCAGAGIAGHIHMHALPRWEGDANFMTTIGETRVLPDDLESSYRRLLAALAN
ncbi:MAG: HIT domain-containing protein [Acidobacteriota bacterium]